MQNTIVTACNHRYLWGALLLIASIRLNHGRDPIKVWASQLSPKEQSLLTQFEGVEVIECDDASPHLRKPEAILNVETEYATWIDSDCMFRGQLDDLLLPRHQGMQIRFRASAENAQVFRKHYSRLDHFGTIPGSILAQWQHDVDEMNHARFTHQCVSNYVSLHRKHFPLIERWQGQIARVAHSTNKPIDPSSRAYFMTDESVLASLLIFSHDCPEISPYRLDVFPERRLIHFGQELKPWETWRFNHLRHYQYVLNVIDSLQQQGYRLPPLPSSLKRTHQPHTFCKSYLSTKWYSAKSACAALLVPFRAASAFARD